MPWYLEAPLSIIAGLLLANFIEWFFHKYAHGLGRVRGRFWSFHFHEHHGNARRHAFRDPCYERFPLGWHAQGKEAWALLLASLAASPLWLVAPWFTATLWYGAANYYRTHRRPTRTRTGHAATCPGTTTTTWGPIPTPTGA